MRYYVAGPMTGYPAHNFPAFDAARDRLGAEGHDVITPADIDRGFGIDGTAERYDPSELRRVFRADIDAVFGADAIYMLRGWEASRGARAEHAVAVWLGKELLYESVT